jgi:hypothetical protein
VPLTFSCQRTITLAGKLTRLPRGCNIIFISWNMSRVITCSDFYPLSNQINLFMVINIWGIIIMLTLVATLYNILVLCCLSHISGVMVSMFASSAVDHKFEHLPSQAKNNSWFLMTGCRWFRIMCPSGATCLPVDRKGYNWHWKSLYFSFHLEIDNLGRLTAKLYYKLDDFINSQLPFHQ